MLPERWWLNPSAEVEAELERQKRDGLVRWLVANPEAGKRLLDTWDARPDKAGLARELRGLAREAWMASRLGNGF